MDEEIKTVSWTETMQFCGGPMRTEVWLRADPPAMSRRTPGLDGQHRVFNADGDQTTSDSQPYILVVDQRAAFTLASVYTAGLAPDSADTRRPETAGESETRVGSRKAWARTDFEKGGQHLAMYERRSIRNSFEVEEMIIADAVTRRIVSRAERQYELQGHQLVSETVRDRYVYNGVAPEGTFEMPSGKERRPADGERGGS